MTVISVRTKNFKQHKDLHINPNGESFFVIGDTRAGKTNLMRVIKSTIMLEDFPKNPLTTGEKDGFVETVHELDGIKFTVSRKFSEKDNGRFTVKDEKGMNASLRPLLDRIFGKAFTNSYFDYNEYFFECKTKETRFNYIIKAMGGDDVQSNSSKIKSFKKERGLAGTQVAYYEAIVNHSSLNPLTVSDDIVTYKDERSYDEAKVKRDEILSKRQSVEKLRTTLDVVKNANDAYEMSEETIKGIDDEIAELETKILGLKGERAMAVQWQENNKPDIKLQAELEQQIQDAAKNNDIIESEAEELYDELIKEINSHNNTRSELKSALVAFDHFNEYQEEWNKLDGQINDLISENKRIFSERLNVPGLTIEDFDGEPTIMYDGREFCYDEISKGDSIRLTMQIQRAINPKGNNFIVIPEAQSLGSDIDEIIKECKDHNIQAIIEVTERKQPFKIEFIEENK